MKASDWDERYRAAEGGLFGEAPNDYLRMALARPALTPRSALLPADGDGRNGTWLGQRGLSVTAVDISGEATRRAVARDRAAGVAAERIVADLAEWRPEAGRSWDLAAILYLQGPAALRRAVARTAAAALAPGGWLLVEVFATGAGGTPGIGPDDPDKRWSVEELHGWLPELETVEAMTGVVRLDEGPRHSGLARVLRLLARRPG